MTRTKNKLEADDKRIRAALPGLVGCDGQEHLGAMESAIPLLSAAQAVDTPACVAAINALRDCPPL